MAKICHRPVIRRRGGSGGWGDGFDPKNSCVHAEETTKQELGEWILVRRVEGQFDAGETTLALKVVRNPSEFVKKSKTQARCNRIPLF